MEPTLDWTIVQAVVISLGLGAIVGLERQSQHRERPQPRPPGEPGSEAVEVEETKSFTAETIGGVRTFALASLLGTIAVLALPASPAMIWVAGLGFCVLVIAVFIAQIRALGPGSGRLRGITTEVSALIVFVLGAMVPSQPLFAASVAVIVATILSVKRYTHKYVSRLSQREIFDTLKLLLVTVVLLPLLPATPIDPWGIYNPRELWFLVVLISAISFAGYFAMRIFGPGRGIALTGAVGGLASSTAVTIAMAQRAREALTSQRILYAATFAILIANAIMAVRVTIEVAVVNPRLVQTLWLPALALALAGLVVALWFLRLSMRPSTEVPDGSKSEAPNGGQATDVLSKTLKNPFRLGPALAFGLIFIVIIAVVHIAQQEFGTSGTYIAALISGLADVDAISLAVARLENTGDISQSVATRAIIIAIIANSLVKAALSTILGTRRLGLYVIVGLLPTLAVGGGIMMLI